MINLKNRQRKIAFDNKQFEFLAQKILDHLGYGDFDLGILLTTNKSIKKFNHEYRNKNKATDVLSFPFHHIPAGERITAQTEDDKNLGDLIISVEFVVAAAQKLNTTFEKRMNRLLVHGICHLLGHDHIEDEEFALMIEKEKSIAKAINLVCSWE